MSVTLVYDDGQQSRHPRYRIPATVEIEHWRYPVQEWSLDGFAVAGVHELASLANGFSARLWFRFDGFSTVVEVNAEVDHEDRLHQRDVVDPGCEVLGRGLGCPRSVP